MTLLCGWMMWWIFVLSTFPISESATTLDIGNNMRVFVPLKSMKAMRDANVIKQAYDYSCGAAALATLLTYGLNDDVTEEQILKTVLTILSKDDRSNRKKEGLSLLDLQKVAHDRGHMAQGFRLTADALSQLGGPVIVFIKPQGYEHFAVLRGVRHHRAYLADPSLGNIRMPLYRFLDMWLDEKRQGVIFVVERKIAGESNGALLRLPQSIRPPFEVLSIRQLLSIGNLSSSVPELRRISP